MYVQASIKHIVLITAGVNKNINAQSLQLAMQFIFNLKNYKIRQCILWDITVMIECMYKMIKASTALGQHRHAHESHISRHVIRAN